MKKAIASLWTALKKICIMAKKRKGVKSPISSCLLFSLSHPSWFLIAYHLLSAFSSSLQSGYSILNERDIDRFIQPIHAFKLHELLGDLTPLLLRVKLFYSLKIILTINPHHVQKNKILFN